MANFSGNPKTEWLSSGGDDRDMQLLEDFSFTDAVGTVWPAPKGVVVNGASIPPALWSTVGSPYTGDYRRASIVHDVACRTAGVDRKAADVMFYQACIAGGCPEWKAKILYAGVRIGAWARKSFVESATVMEGLEVRGAADAPTPEERFMQSKLAQMQTDLNKLPANPSIAELDAVIERHLPM